MLQSRNPHKLDARISFNAQAHTYTVLLQDEYSVTAADTAAATACAVQMTTSTTGVLESISAKFDEDGMAKTMAIHTKNPKYLIDSRRMTVDEIKSVWAVARDMGTALHAAIEMFFNDSVVVDGDGPCDTGDADAVAVATAFLRRACKLCGLEHDGRANVREFSMFLRYWRRLHAEGWRPYRTEFLCYDVALGIGGSVDFLCIHEGTGAIMLLDWKRCSVSGSGFAAAFRGKRLAHPLDHVEDTKLNHWRLQASIYVYLLEKNYNLSIATMAMVAFSADDDVNEAQVFQHERSSDAVLLLQARAHALQRALYGSLPACSGHAYTLSEKEQAEVYAQPTQHRIWRMTQLLKEFGMCETLLAAVAAEV
jgi:hypothetical protein